jgi:hypothetical protein
MIDATEPIAVQDLKIAEKAWDAGKGLVDRRQQVGPGGEGDDDRAAYEKEIRNRAPYLQWVPILFTSTLTGQRVNRALEMILETQEQRQRRISTHEVNEVLRALVTRTKPPAFHGHPVRFLYGTQVATAPPTFVLWCSHPEGVPESYQRYLMNGFRAAWGFVGAPLRIRLRRREEERNDPLAPGGRVVPAGRGPRLVPGGAVGAGDRPARARQRQPGRHQHLPGARRAGGGAGDALRRPEGNPAGVLFPRWDGSGSRGRGRWRTARRRSWGTSSRCTCASAAARGSRPPRGSSWRWRRSAGVGVAVWLLVLRATRMVSPGSIAAALALGVLLLATPVRTEIRMLGLAVVAFVMFAHRSNIVRIMRGEESRFGKAEGAGGHGGRGGRHARTCPETPE